MNRFYSMHSAALMGFLIIPACGRYPQQATPSLESFEIVRSPRASAATLERRDFVPYEGRSLAEALEQLRPDWLRANPLAYVNSKSPTPVLYVNDVVSGEIVGLRTIPSEAAIDVRLLSQSEAWARYGPPCRCPVGVILVRTRSNQ